MKIVALLSIIFVAGCSSSQPPREQPTRQRTFVVRERSGLVDLSISGRKTYVVTERID